jgi:hypothetical protein
LLDENRTKENTTLISFHKTLKVFQYKNHTITAPQQKLMTLANVSSSNCLCKLEQGNKARKRFRRGDSNFVNLELEA